MSTMSVNLDVPPPDAAQPPVIRITPPSRWWVLPIAELWEYRELLYFYVWRELKVRYKQTVVGAAWAVLQPLMTMLVFSLFFGKLAHIPSGGLPYPVFYYSALLPWMYFAASLQNATNKVVENQYVITKVYFPRLVIPFSAVLTSLVDFLITLALMAVLMLWYGFAPGWQLIALPVFVLQSFALALGLGLLLAALNVEYRDFRYVVPFVVQFGLFISPVAFSTTEVPEAWRSLYAVNPLVGIIDGFRWSLLGGRVPLLPETIWISTIVTISMILLGVWYFRRMEHSFADVI